MKTIYERWLRKNVSAQFFLKFYIQGDKAKTFPCFHTQWVIANSNTRRQSYSSEKRRGNTRGSGMTSRSGITGEQGQEQWHPCLGCVEWATVPHTPPWGRNSLLTPRAVRPHTACPEHFLITSSTLSRKWSIVLGPLGQFRSPDTALMNPT